MISMSMREKRVIIRLYAIILSLSSSEEVRMEKIEEFDHTFGSKISGWEKLLIEEIMRAGAEYSKEAAMSVNKYYAKNNICDEDGNLIYKRFNIDGSLRKIIITYDSNAPEEEIITVKEIPY